jgi:hypothetical protein
MIFVNQPATGAGFLWPSGRLFFHEAALGLRLLQYSLQLLQLAVRVGQRQFRRALRRVRSPKTPLVPQAQAKTDSGYAEQGCIGFLRREERQIGSAFIRVFAGVRPIL